MYRFSKIVFFIFLAFQLWGQNQYTGNVFDIGTRLPLSNVDITSTNAGIFTNSNSQGFFALRLQNTQISNNTNNNYFVLNNSFYWDLDQNISIQIYAVDGRVIFQNKLGAKGHFLLPKLPIGYYYLNLTGGGDIVLALFSDGQNYHSVSQNNTTPPAIQVDTSLVFAKVDYYDREILISDTSLNLSVGILRKAYDSLDYFKELIQYEAFELLHSTPSVSNFGEVESIKLLYDIVNKEVFYFNVKKHPNHYWFAIKFLDFVGSGSDFFQSQYSNTPDRYLYMASIDYHKNIDKYVLKFVPFDQITCTGIEELYKKIIATSYFGDKLVFYANSERWADCLDVPHISSEELFLGQNYQALNPAENYGFLRKVKVADLSSTYLGRHDIILLNDVPNDVSVVAGIVTTEFQTPLSHINILSHNRKTPNMALKDGWTNPKLDSLLGELVYLKVASDSFTIRKGNIEEATAFWNANEPQDSILLEKDTSTSGLIQMQDADITFVKTIGGKAANFAELVNMESIPVPENNFAIPFYFYEQHLQKNGINIFIDELLVDEQFASNLNYRKAKLKSLRKLIKNAPIDPDLVSLVKMEINNFENFYSYRFRSSTNAEDLEGFSGAGLYSSYSAKKDHPTKTIERAIKKVWASLWNLRAFDERAYYKINQKSISMGILVHRSFPDEDANGVIVTKNLYNINHGYTINTQYKDYSIVHPEAGILQDQILVYTESLDTNSYTIEYISHANVPELNGLTVLSNSEIFEIADYCKLIKDHYFNLPHNCNCSYSDFAVDLEFKVDSTVEDRKIYIKQARLYSD